MYRGFLVTVRQGYWIESGNIGASDTEPRIHLVTRRQFQQIIYFKLFLYSYYFLFTLLRMRHKKNSGEKLLGRPGTGLQFHH